MKAQNIFMAFTCVLLLVFGTYQNLDAQQNLAQEAYTIFETRCLNCHGQFGAYADDFLMEYETLIETQSVIPGNPGASEFYNRLLGDTAHGPQMPLNQPALPSAEIDTIRRWILAGAPDWNAFSRLESDFITTDEMIRTIHRHLLSLAPRNRPFARYLTQTHLYNAGETPEVLHTYQRALSKLVNSLSWGTEIIRPQPVDPAETIFYIDLRHYHWIDGENNRWTLIEEAYPYGIDYELSTYTQLLQEMDCEVPFVRVDWFIANASLPPLYYDILDLPHTDRELELRLGVDIAKNLQEAPGTRVWRAGFIESGVSENNRVLERHTSKYGMYWKSYDFAGSVGLQNVIAYPLDFRQDGGEMIYSLPNGLQGYFLTSAIGDRLNAAPVTIVSDAGARDPVIRPGQSCMSCHTKGVQTKFEDQVRSVVMESSNLSYDKAQALKLYVEKSEMDAFLEEDMQRYKEAVEAVGGVFGGIQPIQQLFWRFKDPLSAQHAAAEIGLETDVFLQKIRENQSLQELGLQVLAVPNGSVQRDTWTANFSRVATVLDLRPLREPTAISDIHVGSVPPGYVRIPDPNLSAVIASALGKSGTTSSVFSEQELEALIELKAESMSIIDLTGLEFAKNLETLNVMYNVIGDLSPISGLTNLKDLRIRGNPIPGLAPLSKLTALEVLWFSGGGVLDLEPLRNMMNLWELRGWKTSVTDLSVLAGMKKLTHVQIVEGVLSDISGLAGSTNMWELKLYNNKISDISALADFTRLKRLYIQNNNISDLSALADATNLDFLKFDANKASDLSPLAGLTQLRHLDFDYNGLISDLSPLAELSKLEGLNFDRNQISDLSPLANLTGLTHLSVAENQISDVSAISGLINLQTLELYNNKISDISPLSGLINLTKLDLRNNSIVDFSPVEGLPDTTVIERTGNPGGPQGGPKIEGPWLWVLVPGHRLSSDTDLLAQTSRGAVTEQGIATNGAIEGSPVGNNVWTPYKISRSGGNNINQMLDSLAWEKNGYIIYGSIALNSPREQETRMYVGSDDGVKVWLNGVLVRQEIVNRSASDYKGSFPVTLKQGINILLVAVDNSGGAWSGFFGFQTNAEYTVITSGLEYVLSKTEIQTGDTFTVDITAEDIPDLLLWEFDIAFDAAVLEVVEVNEGDFLKTDGAGTFFLSGTIDNTDGNITGLSCARFGDGLSGTGPLMSVTFKAKSGGETELMLQNVRFTSSAGDRIPAGPHAVSIVVEARLPSDVNGDDRVNVLDLIVIAQSFGESASANSRADVNDDGIINILDLILVAQHLGESTTAAAPTTIAIENVKGLNPTTVQEWIAQARAENDGSLAFQQGIANLERLLVSLIPEKTALLANYPNPFNPETWIPYQLSEPAEVTLYIYAVNGTLVRRLALGLMPAGIYQSRSHAAYWDGRNNVGEPVASGIYFYTLTAGEFTSTRKMLIRK